MNILPVIKILLSVGIAGALLITTNQAIEHYQRQQQLLLSARLLDYAQDVSDQVVQALYEAESSGLSDCSDTDLNKLRALRHRYKYIDDIGILKNRHLTCTAGWGRFSVPPELTMSAYKTSDGYLLYKPGKDNPYAKDSENMTAMKDVIVFNSVLTFTDFMQTLPDYPVVLTTHSQQRVFFSSGRSSVNSSRFPESLFTVKTDSCSDLRDLCVSTENPRGGLRLLSLPGVVVITLLGLLSGYMLSSLIYRWFSERKSLEKRFVRALKKGEMFMVYQPIVQARDGQIMALEALVRWQDRHFGLVSPEFFVVLAVRLELYRVLSDLIIRKSLQEMHSLLKHHPQLLLSLNVGDKDIRDHGYLRRLLSQCQQMEIAAGQIKLEITEKCYAEYDEIAEFCLSARQHGFSISLDDFGTGTSNIAWLTRLDFDEVKIDKFIVNNITEPEKGKMLVSVVEGLKKTGKRLVFEGVETCEQLELIQKMESDALIQGWYTGKPVVAEEIYRCFEKA